MTLQFIDKMLFSIVTFKSILTILQKIGTDIFFEIENMLLLYTFDDDTNFYIRS